MVAEDAEIEITESQKRELDKRLTAFEIDRDTGSCWNSVKSEPEQNRKKRGKQSREFNKLRKRLRGQTGKAILEYNMIEDGDRIMVCLSGGKDSWTMLDILLQLQQTAPVRFELIAVNMDQKQPGFPEEVLPGYLDRLQVPYYIIEKDTWSIVKSVIPEGKTTCGLCSRLRRGTLYGFAEEIGATKIALGHHKDDIVETLFLNLFYGGRLKAMPPKLLADDQRNIIIRPMAFCREKDIAAYAQALEFPIIPCNLCGSQENLQRQNIKQMLEDWDRQFPGRTETIFSALTKVSPSQLADTALFDFMNLTVDRSQPPKPHDFTCSKTDNSKFSGKFSSGLAAGQPSGTWSEPADPLNEEQIPLINLQSG